MIVDVFIIYNILPQCCGFIGWK